jgi:hypothetical protein
MSAPPKSDPQRDNIYWLEAEINGAWNIDSSTRTLLRFVADKVCRYYDVDPVLVLTVNSSDKDAAWYMCGKIYLNRSYGGANMHVLLHELSHHIVDEVYEDAENHGPEFAAIYMHLLDKYCILPFEYFKLLAKKHKVKIGRKYRPIAFK